MTIVVDLRATAAAALQPGGQLRLDLPGKERKRVGASSPKRGDCRDRLNQTSSRKDTTYPHGLLLVSLFAIIFWLLTC